MLLTGSQRSYYSMNLEHFIESKIIKNGKDLYDYTTVARSEGISDETIGKSLAIVNKNIGTIVDVENYSGGFGYFDLDNRRKVIFVVRKSPVRDPRTSYFVYKHIAIAQITDLHKTAYNFKQILDGFPISKTFDKKEEIKALQIEPALVDVEDGWNYVRWAFKNANILTDVIKSILLNKHLIFRISEDFTCEKIIGVINGIIAMLPPPLRVKISFMYNLKNLGGDAVLNFVYRMESSDQSQVYVDLKEENRAYSVPPAQSLYAQAMAKTIMDDFVKAKEIIKWCEDVKNDLGEAPIMALDKKLKAYEEFIKYDISSEYSQMLDIIRENSKSVYAIRGEGETKKSIFNGILQYVASKKNLNGISKDNLKFIFNLWQGDLSGVIAGVLKSYEDKIAVIYLISGLLNYAVSGKEKDFLGEFVNILKELDEINRDASKFLELLKIFNALGKDITKDIKPMTKLLEAEKIAKSHEEFLNIAVSYYYERDGRGISDIMPFLQKFYPNVWELLFGDGKNASTVYSEIKDPLAYAEFVYLYFKGNQRLKERFKEFVKEIELSIEPLLEIGDKDALRDTAKRIASYLNEHLTEDYRRIIDRLADVYNMNEYMISSIDEIFKKDSIEGVKGEIEKYIVFKKDRLNITEILEKMDKSQYRNNQEILGHMAKYIGQGIEFIDIIRRIKSSDIYVEHIDKIPIQEQITYAHKMLSILWDSYERTNDAYRILFNLEHKIKNEKLFKETLQKSADEYFENNSHDKQRRRRFKEISEILKSFGVTLSYKKRIGQEKFLSLKVNPKRILIIALPAVAALLISYLWLLYNQNELSSKEMESAKISKAVNRKELSSDIAQSITSSNVSTINQGTISQIDTSGRSGEKVYESQESKPKFKIFLITYKDIEMAEKLKEKLLAEEYIVHIKSSTNTHTIYVEGSKLRIFLDKETAEDAQKVIGGKYNIKGSSVKEVK